MTNRLIHRVRHSNPDLEFLPTERLGRSKRGLSLEVQTLTSNDFSRSLRKDVLLKTVHKIEKENENTRLENLLFSRYLRRVESSKIIETFDEYPDENDILNQTTMRTKVPDLVRRLSLKKSLANSSKTTSLWSKVATNWREYTYAPFLLRIEKEKLPIAAYEIEQTKLDWERMKMNAQLALDHLDVLLRTAESDEIAEATLHADLEKNLTNSQCTISGGRTRHSRVILPVELVVDRIKKRIQSRITSLGLLRINTARAQLRIQAIDVAIQALQDLRDKMDEIDINFVRARKINYSDSYEQLNRRYKIEKSSQYPILSHSQELKKLLFKEEQEKIDYEYKSELLDKRFKKILTEIDSLTAENEIISTENNLLRNQIVDIKQAPTITNYACVIGQTKKLQYEIDIWTRRVNIAETLLSQLQRQIKPPIVLPRITVNHL